MVFLDKRKVRTMKNKEKEFDLSEKINILFKTDFKSDTKYIFIFRDDVKEFIKIADKKADYIESPEGTKTQRRFICIDDLKELAGEKLI